jgi:hypothetical protein
MQAFKLVPPRSARQRRPRIHFHPARLASNEISQSRNEHIGNNAMPTIGLSKCAPRSSTTPSVNNKARASETDRDQSGRKFFPHVSRSQLLHKPVNDKAHLPAGLSERMTKRKPTNLAGQVQRLVHGHWSRLPGLFTQPIEHPSRTLDKCHQLASYLICDLVVRITQRLDELEVVSQVLDRLPAFRWARVALVRDAVAAKRTLRP